MNDKTTDELVADVGAALQDGIGPPQPRPRDLYENAREALTELARRAESSAGKDEYYGHIVQLNESQAEVIKGLWDALLAMVYVHPCNCGDVIPLGHCSRCRAVQRLGFDPALTVEEPSGG